MMGDGKERGESGEYVHPAVQAIDDMVDQYGGQWPPRPSFEGWPPCWKAFEEIAEEMREICDVMHNVDDFRSWMCQQLNEKVDLPEVMKEVHRRMRTDDPVFRGFLAPLSYMVNLYRWGRIPPTDKERMRKTLEFPEALWMPFKTINNFWNLVQRGTIFSLIICNCLYEDPENPDLPTDMRFYFNHKPEMIHSEKNFFISFIEMEITFRPGLFALKEYLTETEAARQSPEYAERVLERRVELLKKIWESLVKVSRVFTRYMKDRMVSQQYWADYVQAVPAWNMNGIDGGASGGESLTFHCVDEFLGTLGEGVIFKGGVKKRQGSPTQYNRILDMLHDHGKEYRFKSFLGHPEKEDPVLKAKDEIIQMLYTWRLSHAKIAPRYLIKSSMTSGGSLDKVLSNGETLSKRGEFELRERARETASFLSTKSPPKIVQAHLQKMKDGTRERELQELLNGPGAGGSSLEKKAHTNTKTVSKVGENGVQISYLGIVSSFIGFWLSCFLSKVLPWYYE